jgi:rfaE bifunctional protein nucleotidyltransferase chain/domain
MILRTKKDLQYIRRKNHKKIIGLCHGVFDILHKGHIDHFNEVRKKCHILVVSITDDKFVKKGPYQPYNSSLKRAKVLEALKFVDYVYVNEDLTPINLIGILKPNFYFKGHDYLKPDLTGNLKRESLAVKKNNGKIFFTKTKVLSSTKILNNELISWSKEQKDFLIKIKSNKFFDYIVSQLDKIRNIKLNIIGEPILDNYIYAKIIGLASKDPALSGVISSKDLVPGGVLPVAQISSLFVDNLKLFTYGNNGLIKPYLNKNIELINLDSTQDIQKKTRYINSHRYQKIFQLTNFEKNFFSTKKNKKISNILREKAFINNSIICDFGVGLFEGGVIDLINHSKNSKYLNIQSNSINFGFNLFTKFKKNSTIKYISLDEREWKLGIKSHNIDYTIIKKFISSETCISITLGKKGSFYYNNHKGFYSPVFIDKVVDTTGCGDAYFAITSLLSIVGTRSDLIPFLGNIYAGMHALNLANKNIPTKIDYIKYIRSLLNF